MEEVKISTPNNLNELPKPVQPFFHDSYIYEEQQVLNLKNCFIAFNGIVLRGLRYVRECFYRPSSYKRKYYPWALKLYLFSFITRWGRSHTVKLDDRSTYAIIHQPYINYFHWTIESLTRYLLLEKSGMPFTLIVPKYLIEISYIRDSLDMLNINNYITVNSDYTIRVKNLLLPAIVRWGTHNHPDLIMELRERMLTGFNARFPNRMGQTHQKLFLIREKGRRKIVNLKEVLEIAKRYDFFVVDFEGMSLEEQITIMSQVKIFVSPHGAGLTNMLFMPHGGTVVEIHTNPLQNQNVIDYSYYHLCSNLKHEYYTVISDKHDSSQDPLFADQFVPIDDLTRILERVCLKHLMT